MNFSCDYDALILLSFVGQLSVLAGEDLICVWFLEEVLHSKMVELLFGTVDGLVVFDGFLGGMRGTVYMAMRCWAYFILLPSI